MPQHIVSFSGGVGSAITAQRVCEEYGRDRVILLFADTLMEHPSTYTFLEDVQTLLQCRIARIADGRDVWQVFEDVRYIGNTRVDPCSKVLKRELIRTYLRDNFDPSNTYVWVGIDCTEEHRLGPIVARNVPFQYRSWLIENDIILDKKSKLAWFTDNKIAVPKLYQLGFAHNNCGGFCVKAGLGQFKLLYEQLPDTYLHHEERELAAMQRNPKLRPFLRKVEQGQQLYLTMREYRTLYLEPQLVSEDESLSYGGCT